MADFLNKFMEANSLDGLVPTLDLEDPYEEDGPLLKDHFLGVVDARSGDQPRCVVFVDPNAHTNGDFPGTTTSNGFYDEYQAPSWMEHSVDLNDLDSMRTTYPSPTVSVSTAAFVEPPQQQQNFIPDPYDFSSKIAYPQEAAVAPQQRLAKSPHVKKSHAEQSEMEYSDCCYYDASGESSIASVHSTTSWASTEEEYPSKEAILEEIHREAAEIERLSVSPPAKQSLRKTKSTKITKPQKRSQSRIPKSFVERKKELNRAAATKYREKKRAERDTLHQERDELETRNTELRAEVTAMASEIDYLKKLIKDIEARTKH